MRDENQLHAAVVELVALDNAQIKYSTVQNWYPGDKEGKGGIYNFVTKRGKCAGVGYIGAFHDHLRAGGFEFADSGDCFGARGAASANENQMARAPLKQTPRRSKAKAAQAAGEQIRSIGGQRQIVAVGNRPHRFCINSEHNLADIRAGALVLERTPGLGEGNDAKRQGPQFT